MHEPRPIPPPPPPPPPSAERLPELLKEARTEAYVYRKICTQLLQVLLEVFQGRGTT